MTAALAEEQITLLAAAIYAATQASKALVTQFGAQLDGWRAMLFNLLLSTVTVLATSPAATRYSLGSAATILLTAAAAAGVHGTVSKLAAKENNV